MVFPTYILAHRLDKLVLVEQILGSDMIKQTSKLLEKSNESIVKHKLVLRVAIEYLFVAIFKLKFVCSVKFLSTC